MKKIRLLGLLYVLVFTSLTIAQPSNNLCLGAIELTVGATCNNTLVTINGTETGSLITNPGCASYAGGDLWYKVQIPASGNVAIEGSYNATIMNVGMAIYKGNNCGELSFLLCNVYSGEGNFPRAGVPGDPNEIVYIRVWEVGNDLTGSFNLCVYEIDPPENDKHFGASELLVENNYENIQVELQGTETYSSVADPECTTYNGGDLWYKLNLPASGEVVVQTSNYDGSINDTGMEIYAVSESNEISLIDCDDDGNGDSEGFEKISVSGSEGDEIKIRIWQLNNEGIGFFNLCAFDPLAMGISNTETDNLFNIFPNPAKTVVTIKLQESIVGSSNRAKIYDILGKNN